MHFKKIHALLIFVVILSFAHFIRAQPLVHVDTVEDWLISINQVSSNDIQKSNKTFLGLKGLCYLLYSAKISLQHNIDIIENGILVWLVRPIAT